MDYSEDRYSLIDLYWSLFSCFLHMSSIFSPHAFPLIFFETVKEDSESSEVDRMSGKKKCGDCVMIDFYKNDVVVNSNRKNDSLSYSTLVQQETDMTYRLWKELRPRSPSRKSEDVS